MAAAPAAALAHAVAGHEAHPAVEALEAVAGPKAVVLSAESAALVVAPMDCPAAVVPRVAMGPKVCLDHQHPKDVRLNSLPSADGPGDLPAAVPALAFRKSAKPGAQTASGTLLWTLVEHKSSPMLL